jgi:hypothetical protein
MLGMPGEIEAVVQRLRRRTSGDDGRQIENRQRNHGHSALCDAGFIPELERDEEKCAAVFRPHLAPNY